MSNLSIVFLSTAVLTLLIKNILQCTGFTNTDFFYLYRIDGFAVVNTCIQVRQLLFEFIYSCCTAQVMYISSTTFCIYIYIYGGSHGLMVRQTVAKCRWGSECTALYIPSIPRLRCPWARHQTPICSPGAAASMATQCSGCVFTDTHPWTHTRLYIYIYILVLGRYRR